LDSLTCLSNLDLFIVNNGALELKSIKDHSDYDSLSGFCTLSNEALPKWISADKIQTCLKLTDRPWYSIFSPARKQWINLVKDLILNKKLTIETIKQDISDGSIRPSLLADIESALENRPLPPPFFNNIDSVFVYQEMRVSDIQYKLLHSKELQQRTIINERKNRKGKKASLKIRIAAIIGNRGENTRAKVIVLVIKSFKHRIKKCKRIIKRTQNFTFRIFGFIFRSICKITQVRKN